MTGIEGGGLRPIDQTQIEGVQPQSPTTETGSPAMPEAVKPSESFSGNLYILGGVGKRPFLARYLGAPMRKFINVLAFGRGERSAAHTCLKEIKTAMKNGGSPPTLSKTQGANIFYALRLSARKEILNDPKLKAALNLGDEVTSPHRGDRTETERYDALDAAEDITAGLQMARVGGKIGQLLLMRRGETLSKIDQLPGLKSPQMLKGFKSTIISGLKKLKPEFKLPKLDLPSISLPKVSIRGLASGAWSLISGGGS